MVFPIGNSTRKKCFITLFPNRNNLRKLVPHNIPDCLNRWTYAGGDFLVGFTGMGSDSAALVSHSSSREVGGTHEKQSEFTSKTNHTKCNKPHDPRSQGVYFRKLP